MRRSKTKSEHKGTKADPFHLPSLNPREKKVQHGGVIKWAPFSWYSLNLEQNDRICSTHLRMAKSLTDVAPDQFESNPLRDS